MTGTCPKCEVVLEFVVLEHVPVTTAGTSWHGVSYLCPHCRAVLGVGIDPFALKADIVDEVIDAMRKLKPGPTDLFDP